MYVAQMILSYRTTLYLAWILITDRLNVGESDHHWDTPGTMRQGKTFNDIFIYFKTSFQK